jgi:hypothetical protein
MTQHRPELLAASDEMIDDAVRYADPMALRGVLYGDSTGALCGAVTVNWPRAIALCRHALAARTPYEKAPKAATGTRR